MSENVTTDWKKEYELTYAELKATEQRSYERKKVIHQRESDINSLNEQLENLCEALEKIKEEKMINETWLISDDALKKYEEFKNKK